MRKTLEEISEAAEYFFRKIGRIPRQIKKAKKAEKDFLLQAQIAEKLDGYIADFLGGKIKRFRAVPKKAQLAGKKIIWQYWHQGINEKTPKVVSVCLDSVKKHMGGDYERIILTEDNLNDYIELPDFVWKRLNTGGYNLTKLSNLVRLYLLSAYGGVWLDATVYLTKPIEESWLEKDFFALQRSEAPPSDLKIFTRFDPIGLNWKPQSYVRMQSSFLIAKPNHKIINDHLSLLLEYWRKEEHIGHYFFFQICFYRMMQYEEWKNLNCETVCYADYHRFLIAGFDRFNKALFDTVAARWNVHKLTLYWAKKRITPSSFAGAILNGRTENFKAN